MSSPYSRSKKNVLLFLFFIVGFSFTHTAFSYSDNLIINPDLEITDAAGLPVDWTRGRWGNNNASFGYPTTGVDNSKGGTVTITERTSGDAKWSFKPVSVVPGKKYEFSNYYSATVSTYITLQYKRIDGSFFYVDIAQPTPQTTLTQTNLRFIVPPNVETVTVFHLLNKVGSLTVDRFYLKEIIPPPEEPDSLIQNASLENLNTANLPERWSKGRWGTNTALFSFPVNGQTGTKAARVSLSSYTSGDAKWYHEEVTVEANAKYQFSNFYQSDIPSYITVQFRLSNNTFSYQDLGNTPPSPTWRAFNASFTAPSNAVTMMVFHVIKNIGFLDVDTYSLKKTASDLTRFNKGMVSLQFDDGWKSIYQNAVPVLDQANFKSTQFIVSGYLEPTFPGYMRVNEVLDMQARGHEIGAHTRTHSDLTTLSTIEARAEIQGSRDDLLAIGLTPVNFFAYPFGSYNTSVINLVKEASFSGGRSSDGGFNFKTQDPFAMRRQPMTNTTTFNEIKGYIDQALTDRTWVILLFHEINNSSHQYSITPALFQQTIDYLKQKNVTPVTMNEGLNLMK